jgi:hypothetical protein
MSFQIHALAPTRFEPLFSLSDDELANALASRKIVDARPGYPCRVSLTDAEIGETVILVNFKHQAAESPFQSTHAIYVRENAQQAFPEPGTIPELLETRLISIRAFNDKDCIVDADVVDGSRLSESIPAMLQDPAVVYLHLHNANLGCFMARATRA